LAQFVWATLYRQTDRTEIINHAALRVVSGLYKLKLKWSQN